MNDVERQTWNQLQTYLTTDYPIGLSLPSPELFPYSPDILEQYTYLMQVGKFYDAYRALYMDWVMNQFAWLAKRDRKRK